MAVAGHLNGNKAYRLDYTAEFVDCNTTAGRLWRILLRGTIQCRTSEGRMASLAYFTSPHGYAHYGDPELRNKRGCPCNLGEHCCIDKCGDECNLKCAKRRQIVQCIQDEDGCTVREYLLRKGSVGELIVNTCEPFTGVQVLIRDCAADGHPAPPPVGLVQYAPKLIKGVHALDIHPRDALAYMLHDAVKPAFRQVSGALMSAAGDALRNPLCGKPPIIYWVQGRPPPGLMNRFVEQVLTKHNVSAEEASKDVWYYNVRQFGSCIGQIIWVIMNDDQVLTYAELCALTANRGSRSEYRTARTSRSSRAFLSFSKIADPI